MIEVKLCVRCEAPLPIGCHATRKYCDACNKERIRKIKQKYDQANREKIRKRQQKWRDVNREKIRERDNDWHNKNKAKTKAHENFISMLDGMEKLKNINKNENEQNTEK